MKYRLSILATVCSVAIAVVLFLRSLGGPPTDFEAAAASGEVRGIPSPKAQLGAAPLAAQEESAPVSDTGSISDDFERATDYLDFANSILERGKNGDADAQYYLYGALQYCEDSYRGFFRRANKPTRTLDEALLRVSTLEPAAMDAVRIAYARCSRMFDGGSRALGTFDSWLKLATQGEQPVALVISATDMLSNAAPGIDRDAAMKAAEPMLMKALKSGNPEAMWGIGSLQPLLSEDDDEDTLREWAWILVACQRGYDCEKSRWMEYGCRFDQQCVQDRDAIDFIRRMTDLGFPEVESRAKAINAKIDAKAWDELEREITGRR